MESNTQKSNELVTIEGVTMPEIVKAFSLENGLDPLLEKIKQRVRSEHMDVTTEEGRARIGSVARQIGSAKMDLKRAAQKLTEDWREKTKAVTSETSRMERVLDALRDEVLKPRDEFEQIEKDRIQRHTQKLDTIIQLSQFIGFEPTSVQVQERIDTLSTLMDKAYDWQEFYAKAAEQSGNVEKALAEMLLKRKKAEEEAAELERLRKAEEARLQKERDEKIAADAAAKAKQEAEEKARKEQEERDRIAKAEQERIQREKDEAAAKAKAEQERVEQEKRDAIARAEKAEADKKAAEQKAKEDAIKAEADKKAAAEAAAKAERDRQAEEQRKQKEADDKRAADKAHRAKINNEALAVVQGIVDELSAQQKSGADIAKEIIIKIAEGKVPNVSIKY